MANKKIDLKRQFLIEEYLEKNKTCGEISRELGVHSETIRRRLKVYSISKKKNLNEQEIIESYLNKRLSPYKLAVKFGCSYQTIYRILNKNKVKIFPLGYFMRGKSSWNKGLTKDIDERIRGQGRSFSKKYNGRKHPLYKRPRPEKVKQKISLSQMGKNNSFYGKKHTEEWKTQIRAKQICPLKDTSIEVKIQNFLKQLGIEFFTHQYMKEIEHAYQCDILIPSMNMVIECDGDYWHKYPVGNEVDHIRTCELLDKGFKVLRLWEHEIKVMDLNNFREVLVK